MTITKTLTLSVAGAIILAAHSTPSLAAKTVDATTSKISNGSNDAGLESFWEYLYELIVAT